MMAAQDPRLPQCSTFSAQTRVKMKVAPQLSEKLDHNCHKYDDDQKVGIPLMIQKCHWSATCIDHLLAGLIWETQFETLLLEEEWKSTENYNYMLVVVDD